ncbi:L-aspartate oxidase [Sulfobacillus thermosulfidooxidans]|uniref:L-aspartate oxidase n=1 Tax=Sulfobacillus thermosulfidooxidans TaxID=28034 RepID=UPI0006B542E3|nr:FAD-dependent oxidoreductase [Sulfobacillus thermosulfidooxidans]
MNVQALVIGAGIAGLATALEMAQFHDVLICAPAEGWKQGSTYRAQGGVAVALGPDDHWRYHLEDTLTVTRGLADPGAVRILVQEGPDVVRSLIEAGIFQMVPGSRQPALGREAGHRQSRILHAPGSLTGQAIAQYLYDKASHHPRIHWVEGEAEQLIMDSNGYCRGSWIRTPAAEYFPVLAPVTVLATGGYGALWRYTTNSPGSIGQGLWLAYEAGAELVDLEFLQFHPTVLSEPGVERGHALLLTEALRGFGAHLINEHGERFMKAYPGQELAGRDEVARAVYQQKQAFLTLKHLNANQVYEHFGKLAELVAKRGFDLAHDLLPVAAGAHFSMGGVRTDHVGQSSIPGLFAVGEVACTGVHGANRLASNSLLEALVFARRIAEYTKNVTTVSPVLSNLVPPTPQNISDAEILEQLGDLMDEYFGVIRCPEKMALGLKRLHDMHASRPHWILALSLLIAKSAFSRKESRGAHYRSDVPQSDSKWAGHLIHQKQQGTHFQHLAAG